MTKITRVGALDDDTLDIELDNGNVILLDLGELLAQGRFAALKDRLRFPKTDGDRVFWDDGTCITLSEIFSMIQR